MCRQSSYRQTQEEVEAHAQHDGLLETSRSLLLILLGGAEFLHFVPDDEATQRIERLLLLVELSAAMPLRSLDDGILEVLGHRRRGCRLPSRGAAPRRATFPRTASGWQVRTVERARMQMCQHPESLQDLLRGLQSCPASWRSGSPLWQSRPSGYFNLQSTKLASWVAGCNEPTPTRGRHDVFAGSFGVDGYTVASSMELRP